MDRRHFLRTLFFFPVFSPLVMSFKSRQSERQLYVITSYPQDYIPSILQHLAKYGIRCAHNFTFLNSSPCEQELKNALKQKGWEYVKESSPSDISFRFFRLHRKVHPSFTFTQGGKILDIRHQKLASLWRHMKMKENGSPFLFMASFSSHKNISHPGTSVSVYADGRRVDCLSLQKNTIKLYSTPKGEVRVRVERGRAGIVESSCDHKICCLSPPVSLAGERIICAPNHFLIKINPSPFVDTSIG